ncbi:hypothetical protein ACIQXI_16350 [Lysinibacillus sp. NPDC097195]|uniref:hypothetical protein n=1 Tax=Lysinibacillus sp. NPDC097195 TaxID=3364141 RepID=UPI0037FBD6C8
MSYVNKHLARTLEQQHKRSVRGLFLKIQDLNNDCLLLRKRLEQHIDLTQYKDAIDYVDQFVSYTSILNLKFVTNTQNLEVVVLHALLLEYIIEQQSASTFDYELNLLHDYMQEILALNEHASTLFSNHKEKMLRYIEKQNI